MTDNVGSETIAIKYIMEDGSVLKITRIEIHGFTNISDDARISIEIDVAARRDKSAQKVGPFELTEEQSSALMTYLGKVL